MKKSNSAVTTWARGRKHFICRRHVAWVVVKPTAPERMMLCGSGAVAAAPHSLPWEGPALNATVLEFFCTEIPFLTEEPTWNRARHFLASLPARRRKDGRLNGAQAPPRRLLGRGEDPANRPATVQRTQAAERQRGKSGAAREKALPSPLRTDPSHPGTSSQPLRLHPPRPGPPRRQADPRHGQLSAPGRPARRRARTLPLQGREPCGVQRAETCAPEPLHGGSPAARCHREGDVDATAALRPAAPRSRRPQPRHVAGGGGAVVTWAWGAGAGSRAGGEDGGGEGASAAGGVAARRLRGAGGRRGPLHQHGVHPGGEREPSRRDGPRAPRQARCPLGPPLPGRPLVPRSLPGPPAAAPRTAAGPHRPGPQQRPHRLPLFRERRLLSASGRRVASTPRGLGGSPRSSPAKRDRKVFLQVRLCRFRASYPLLVLLGWQASPPHTLTRCRVRWSSPPVD